MNASPRLLLALVLTICVTLATGLAPRATAWSSRAQSDTVLGMLFGDGRKLFASQFFTMADVYFHSGYYPGVFDRKGKEIHIEEATHDSAGGEGEKMADFRGPPRDWIEAFGRRFLISEHRHLQHGDEREILPWLKLAADLDPQMIDTYTVGSYWLRQHLHQPLQAEAFLREGLRNNPASYEILFELGRLYEENLEAPDRARNVWELALRCWQQQPPEAQKENRLGYEEITLHLARLEEKAGNWADALRWLQAAQTVSPAPENLQKQIDALRGKLADPASWLLPQTPY